MKVAIIGHGADKFTPTTEQTAKEIIRVILQQHKNDTIVSGHSPMGGIDIWAETIAQEMGLQTQIFAPTTQSWNPEGGYGYKARNLDIAHASDLVYVIVVRNYPINYKGRRFDYCYHCYRNAEESTLDHVKSGACWTAKKAKELGKKNKVVCYMVSWKVGQIIKLREDRFAPKSHSCYPCATIPHRRPCPTCLIRRGEVKNEFIVQNVFVFKNKECIMISTPEHLSYDEYYHGFESSLFIDTKIRESNVSSMSMVEIY